MRPALPLVTGACIVVVGVVACLPGSGPPLAIYQDDAGSPPPVTLGDGGTGPADVDLGDPFAVTGLAPSHGPWNGGTTTTMSGRGFPSTLGVFIGGTQLDPSAVLASSPTQAQIVTPGGPPGPADVTILDPATAEQRTLAAGFYYDSFYAQPNTGATTGGTRITLLGEGTAWASGTTVTVASNTCTNVTVVDATHIQCTTPAGSPGTVDISITLPDGTFAQALDAYTYADSVDGYRGGLSGGTLSGTLHVLLLDGYTGDPIPHGHGPRGRLAGHGAHGDHRRRRQRGLPGPEPHGIGHRHRRRAVPPADDLRRRPRRYRHRVHRSHARSQLRRRRSSVDGQRPGCQRRSHRRPAGLPWAD